MGIFIRCGTGLSFGLEDMVMKQVRQKLSVDFPGGMHQRVLGLAVPSDKMAHLHTHAWLGLEFVPRE